MESVIAVLPDAVVDQIAAGEVIERPASVVKELVDNAIDAGARTITVEVSAGGRTIRVLDDGCGMSARDAVLAFERHATSKLRAVDELWGLPTMGFRGEALPSIASVARVVLVTRRSEDLAATRVQIEGSKLLAVTEVGAPVGTCVEVADLLYNVPARLKFLKGEATEASHVTELVARIAMAHPSLHVRLRHNGRTALDLAPDRDALGRAQALLGARVAARLVSAAGEEAGVRVRAFLGAPELAQTTARGVQLFVGKRPVRDRGVLHAIAMGYGELVPRGRYPVAIVTIDAPPGAVDINVHPQKHEVRFADPGAVCAAVRHVVQQGVAAAPWRDEVAGPVMMSAIASVAPPRLPLDAPAQLSVTYAAQLRDAQRIRDTAQARLDFAAPAREWVRDIKQQIRDAAPDERLAEGSSPVAAPNAAAAAHGAHDTPAGAWASQPTSQPGFFARLRYLGQLDLTYLVCEADGELVLLDQHVAHERVELARLRALSDHAVATQRLLFPTTIELPAPLVERAAALADALARVGYEVDAFGATSLAIKAVPGTLRHGDPATLLRALLAHDAGEGEPDGHELVDRALAEIACHSVVRAGDPLTAADVEALLRALDGVDADVPNPHGRPVLLRLPLAEIARRFGR
ncbi:MAG: DNA mismatch repair endonuclease MutL [Deltaproteobacteria bacterium]|nr:DNA mismatch repair endonuclease MutL [Deltaproteobacteria bacterium]